MWYDRFGRMEDTVRYGTYNGADFDRDALSVPSRGPNALRTTNVYNTDGTLLSVNDPKDLETRYFYDDAGRQIKTIANYTDGTPGGGADGDQDQVVEYGFTNGLRVTMTAKMPSSADDQTTTYTHGTAKGTDPGDSKIATGHLLQKITYPDSSSGTDVVTFAYNAQNQQMWRKDQAGNIFENVFDDMGRTVHRRATAINTGAGFDDEVQRISYTYDVLGRQEYITQWDDDAPGSGNELDEVKFAYDGWGNIITLQQDVDSEIGGAGNSEYEISYTYTEATVGGGRETLQRSTMTYPNGNVISYSYTSRSGTLDNMASRVTEVKDGLVVLAYYQYNGTSHVVRTDYDEIDVYSRRFVTPGVISELDRYNRPVNWTWTKDLTTDQHFYEVDYTWDQNSNVTAADDQIWPWFIDRTYELDDLNRLIEERMINPDWLNNGEDSRTLTQAGAATRVKLNLEDDTDYTGPGEMDDTRVYNKANELQTRDTDSNASVNYTLSHDAVGNLTDDGQANEYVYDVWGRVRFVNNQTPLPVSEYRYNGLNWRISVSHDTDSDDDIDASDIIHHFIHDERWRIVAVYRENDSDPKEQFVYHTAGQNGVGTASYIDDVILRDKDASDDWENAADATLEERIYYCQNWRHDVVALIDSAGGGTQVEQQRYEAYGVPYLFVAGDMTANGGINATDLTEIQALIDLPGYDVRADLDLDGDVDATDKSLASANSSKGAGREKLAVHSGNRKGYAGYEFDDSIAHMSYHVRNRVLNSTLGQFLRRHEAEESSRSQYLVQDGEFEVLMAAESGFPRIYPAPGDQCAAGLIARCRDNAAVKRAREYVQQACAGANCTAWAIKCENPGGTALARTVCADCKIKVKGTTTCGTLAHEIIHAGDFCKKGCRPDGGPGFQGCENQMCSEIRAVPYGCCGDTSGSATACIDRELDGYRRSQCGQNFTPPQWDALLRCCLISTDCGIIRSNPVPPIMDNLCRDCPGLVP